MSGGFKKPRIAAAVMAAGASSRMSAIKQLLPWQKTTLLGHVIEQIKQTDTCDIFLVVGAHHKEILETVNTDGIQVIYNENWSSGMGSSISKMVGYIEKNQLDFDGLLIAVSDQPLLKVDHYNELINSSINKERIVCSYYNDSPGVPVVFDRIYFEQLKLLNEDYGAKSIIKKHLDHMICMDAPDGAIDLDTKDEYEKYYHTHGNKV